ncbi:exonuclease domain-containing protein [Paenactinomyces guangxiensis]|uniref:Exonuclease domain-containing protein n=2 Tax=Paenactinomyces guangxiensis TaxID=1490290 RepID=A0A7W1WNV7_9BACL|nr:exonuclease domain-containing protein [Paenactinomyces guangxiensis]MBH8589822.1 exonuclease domain-containing protein [Paenactinomyces guangxiensis]
MYLFVIDFEATCYEKNPPPRFFSEIIEVGGVIVNPQTREVINEYQTFVKPVLFPKLSLFCTALTSITQEQVNQGIPFAQAVQELRTFSTKYPSIFCSWGHYDRKQLKRQCNNFQVSYPFSAKHINLKEAHSQFYNVRRMGMKGALLYHGLSITGTHHRGIDDARNIAKITQKMLAEGWNWKDSEQSY